jgi:hypothetical protein
VNNMGHFMEFMGTYDKDMVKQIESQLTMREYDGL